MSDSEAKGSKRRPADDEDGSSDDDGIDLMGNDDSSDDENIDDPEELKKIAEGFIADDDDSRRKRKKKKKRRREKKSDEEDAGALDEDDLELVAQNTGTFRKLKRLKRRRDAEDSDHLDSEDEAAAENTLDQIFNDVVGRRAQADDEDDMADFIEEDSADEGEQRDRQSIQARKEERKKQQQKARGGLPLDGMGIDKEIWDEIQEVFGNGEDYAWALEDEMDEEDKPAPTLHDIFEPSEIAERMLTAADDIIRSIDIPERMQIAQTGLELREISETLLDPEELDAAADWIAFRVSPQHVDDFLLNDMDGNPNHFKEPFMRAVRNVVEYLCVEFLEVPFILHNRGDYLVHYDAELPIEHRARVLLSGEDLWKVYSLCIKYRAFLDKKASLEALWSKASEVDDYYEELAVTVDSTDEVIDVIDWVSLKYSAQLKAQTENAEPDIDENGDEVAPKETKRKKAIRDSRYERAKSGMISQFAASIGSSSEQIAQDFLAGHKQNFMDDPVAPPLQEADKFVDPNSEFMTDEIVLTAAKLLLSTDIGKDPILRKEIRKAFKSFGAVSVRPTDKGQSKIDEMHPYNAFKYLENKPVELLITSAQFLQILAAESENLVTVDIHLQADTLSKLQSELYNVYVSDLTSDDASAWNDFRKEVIDDALETFLLPMGAKWTREMLQDEEEDWICRRCGVILEERIDVAPIRAYDNQPGDPPRTLAISHGRGDMQRDPVHFVYLDEEGRLLDHFKLNDLRTPENIDRLKAHLLKQRPEVVIVGGFTPSTMRLCEELRVTLTAVEQEIRHNISLKRDKLDPEEFESEMQRAPFNITQVYDDVARLYQHSTRAQTEFGELEPIARYCVALARYAQSPLHEYAALGADLPAIKYSPHQQLVPKDRLLLHLQRALVNIVNAIGVNINQAVHNEYQRYLLPFVAGLGSRKAYGLVNKINANGGTLVTRAQLVQKDMVASRVFMNCASFLRITPDDVNDPSADILDSTRIHNEDYHIARKMAADAEELDEEDVADLPNPSAPVVSLMEKGAESLNELSLDDFAVALEQTQGLCKRLTLYKIRDELQAPYADKRSTFKIPSAQELFTMLTGETSETLTLGFIIPVVVQKVLPSGGILCRLDSGIDGMIEPGYISDQAIDVKASFKHGQTLQALVIDIYPQKFAVDLSILPNTLQQGDAEQRKVRIDKYYDTTQAVMDAQAVDAKQKKGQARQRRVVKHPNFFNFNAGQAEQHLANQQRGDCVIRPSSRGVDHLAVTWKVDEGIYQHIDVLELDKPNEFSLGRRLKVGRYDYADLDELIVSHIRAMARKVEEMLAHDKYKGTEKELHQALTNAVLAAPDKSAYGFAIDHRRPGQFILAFHTKGQEIQSWPVLVLPNAFKLKESDEVPDVLMLCNAFKSLYFLKLQQGAASGKTPFPGAHGGGRTPNPYGRTPGYQGGATPNPYGGGRTPNPYGGGRTPNPLAPPQHGGRTPNHYAGAGSYR